MQFDVVSGPFEWLALNLGSFIGTIAKQLASNDGTR